MSDWNECSRCERLDDELSVSDAHVKALKTELQATAELAVKYRELLREGIFEDTGDGFDTIVVEALALEPTGAMKRLEKK